MPKSNASKSKTKSKKKHASKNKTKKSVTRSKNLKRFSPKKPSTTKSSPKMNDEWFQRCFMDIINPFDSEGHNENADDVLFERSDFLENQLKCMNKKQKVFT